MNRFLVLCFLLLISPLGLFAQAGASSNIRVVTSPPGACVVGSGSVVIYQGVLYTCNNAGTFVSIVGGDLSNPIVGDAIQYVSPYGNDTNSGLSWALAKLTVTGALQALPSGSTGVIGAGTVYVAPGSQLNAAGTTYGLWIMGSNDPNYSSPPTGWLKCPNTCVPTIVGIPNLNGGPNPHQGRAGVVGGNNADTYHPGFWISGLGGPVWFQNLHFTSSLGRVGVIGECSNHLRTNTCTTTNVTLDNVGGAPSGGSSMGPGLDIAG